ncbi:peptidase [Platysternon megacephalum]|uniref:Peptidase n=1 Tax=Platysternon megacephalum TaxID=55544 RepID=A0A4D9DEE7_9SAUR|nr:peptidase [Platysternon megacephalum]
MLGWKIQEEGIIRFPIWILAQHVKKERASNPENLSRWFYVNPGCLPFPFQCSLAAQYSTLHASCLCSILSCCSLLACSFPPPTVSQARRVALNKAPKTKHVTTQTRERGGRERDQKRERENERKNN